MPDGPLMFPCSEAGIGLIPCAGRQSAILAKTLFVNRFSCLSRTGKTQGMRLGGRGFQRIKKALREIMEFEVFRHSPARCASHNSPEPQSPYFCCRMDR